MPPHNPGPVSENEEPLPLTNTQSTGEQTVMDKPDDPAPSPPTTESNTAEISSITAKDTVVPAHHEFERPSGDDAQPTEEQPELDTGDLEDDPAEGEPVLPAHLELERDGSRRDEVQPMEDQLADQLEDDPVGPLSDGESDDSYGKSAGQVRHKKMHRREKGYATSPTTSEIDEEDDRQTIEQHRLRPSPVVEEPSEAGQEEQPKFRRGPMDDETRMAALALKEEYDEKMEALSKERNVSLHALYRIVGDDTVKHRAVSVWNAFQRYEAVHNPKPKDGKLFFVYVPQ